MRESRSFQDEIPKERINIKFVRQTGDAQEEVELPLKLLMLGDYTLKEPSPDDPPLDEKERISVDKQNFQDVMEGMDLGVKLTVPNRLIDEEGEEMIIDLKFKDLDSFRPEAVAPQVKELKAILAVRNLLEELKAHVITNRQFRRALEDIVKTNLDGTIADLEKLAPMPESLKGGGESESSEKQD